MQGSDERLGDQRGNSKSYISIFSKRSPIFVVDWVIGCKGQRSFDLLGKSAIEATIM